MKVEKYFRLCFLRPRASAPTRKERPFIAAVRGRAPLTLFAVFFHYTAAFITPFVVKSRVK
jgi:hypothetical protein